MGQSLSALKSPLRAVKLFLQQRLTARWFLILTTTRRQRHALIATGDPIRYGTIELSLQRIQQERISGSVAECGVYKGALSKFIHERVPDRTLYLFDTFQGFDPRDSEADTDARFRDTSEEEVLRHIGDTNGVVIRKGFFPTTTSGLEDKHFALVVIDFDKYEPTMAALEFFYPRVQSGGFIIVHDYTSPESSWACSRALDQFLADKPERPVVIPDAWGTALFRKS